MEWLVTSPRFPGGKQKKDLDLGSLDGKLATRSGEQSGVPEAGIRGTGEGGDASPGLWVSAPSCHQRRLVFSSSIQVNPQNAGSGPSTNSL